MRIWFDLSNSPHVVFFAGMIRELSAEHEILITCRDLANTLELLDLEGFEYHVVGRHYGARKSSKILGFGVRVAELRRFVARAGADAAVAHSSYYSPVVAASLGIPSLYLNDNEHAEGNRFAFLCASRVMMPEFVPLASLRRQWLRERRFAPYPGVKEGVYLWQLASRIRREAPAARHARKTIIVRPEPWAAHYYAGRTNFIDALLQELSREFRVVVLPRGADQAAHYRAPAFAGIEVPERSLALTDVMTECDLFLGAGGTMTREAAVLGIPTISIYQEDLLQVDRYLIEQGFMAHAPEPTSALVRERLARATAEGPRTALLEQGRAAYAMIKEAIVGLPARRAVSA